MLHLQVKLNSLKQYPLQYHHLFLEEKLWLDITEILQKSLTLTKICICFLTPHASVSLYSNIYTKTFVCPTVTNNTVFNIIIAHTYCAQYTKISKKKQCTMPVIITLQLNLIDEEMLSNTATQEIRVTVTTTITPEYKFVEIHRSP